MDTRTARDLPANPRHQDLLHMHQVRAQHPSIPTRPTRRTTPASQPTCRTSAWRGGGIARTYAATVRAHVETLELQLLY